MFVKLYFTVPENKLSPIMSNVHEGQPLHHRLIFLLPDRDLDTFNRC